MNSYTLRNRRSPELRHDAERQATRSRFALDALEARPGVATEPPQPFGDLSRAGTAEIIKLAGDELGSQLESPRVKRRAGARNLLEYLAGFDGATWQERWEASDLDAGGRPVSALAEVKFHGYNLTHGLKALCCLRVLRPSLVAFRSNKFNQYPIAFEVVQGNPILTKFFEQVSQSQAAERHRYRALYDVCAALTTQGIAMVDLTPSALLHYAVDSRRQGVTVADGKGTRFPALLAWDTLVAMGHFPPGTPPTLRASLYKGQRSVEEMIDYSGIRNPEIRQLLIDYVTRRKADTDYNTQEGLARILADNFWSAVERIAPDQEDLNLPEHVYQQWRETISYRKDGAPRLDTAGTILLPVRAFYMDIHSWALAEPERWGCWAAPCPIPPSDLRGFGARRRRITERMADRVRVRQPLLPTLVARVDEHYTAIRELHDAARATALGEYFTCGGRTYQRTNTRTDQRHHDDAYRPLIRATDVDTGAVRHLTNEEEAAFWEWAYLEVLRHTGIRVEEMVELAHTSVRQYQRPNGEVIALLVVAPSKTDRERVIPMSAELFHVIASIIRRQTDHGPIPLLPRYDGHERQWTAPLPYLFQRQAGQMRAVTSTATVLNTLRRRCQQIAETDPAFRGLHFTPHDFRRIFATDLVNSGLPIHIGAALLGHLSIQTTRGYVAVFEEDVVRHYQRFLVDRRELRPVEEYRAATETEMAEFEEHFDKRKVELGSCARPYGTPCQHEHACIRCPMLDVNPKMLPRLQELEDDLGERRARAVAEGWLGEIEGIDLTLRFLANKRARAQRLTRATGPTALAMPTLRTAEGD